MDTDQPTLSSVITRVFWMMLGPMVLLLLAVSIINMGTSWLTSAAIGFFVVLALVIACRGFEFYLGSPRTSAGEPATPSHLRRYVAGAVVVGLSVWAFADILSIHILGR